jgi:hypothetical protein
MGRRLTAVSRAQRFPEETFHSFSYSPLYDDKRQNGWDALCGVTRKPSAVSAERARGFSLEIWPPLSTNIKTQKDVFDALEPCVGSDVPDLPFTLTYLFDSNRESAHLVSTTVSMPLAPDRLRHAASLWPLSRHARCQAPVVVDELPHVFAISPSASGCISPSRRDSSTHRTAGPDPRRPGSWSRR